jgi:hypothetical protein
MEARLFEFEKGIITRTSIFVIFSMTDYCCISSFYKVVSDVFAGDGNGCSVTSFESFSSRFGIIDLDMDLILALHLNVVPISR